MAVTNPEKPVTRGEVAAYVTRVVMEERRRIALAIQETSDPAMLSEFIGDQRPDPNMFDQWPQT